MYSTKSSTRFNNHIGLNSHHFISHTLCSIDLLQKAPKGSLEVSMALEGMDRLHSGVFSEWIKSEDNLPLTIKHLSRIAKEYPIHRIVVALRWLFTGWKLKSIAFMVTEVTADWENESQLALFVQELTEGWKVEFRTGLSDSIMRRWDLNARNITGMSTKDLDICRQQFRAAKIRYLTVFLTGLDSSTTLKCKK